MTESKALEFMRLFREDWDRNSKTENAKALDVAIKALEEMKKIKELGECYIIPKNGVWEVNGIDIHKALEKQIPKEVVVVDYALGETEYRCPSCSLLVSSTYCEECGQKIDWGLDD